MTKPNPDSSPGWTRRDFLQRGLIAGAAGCIGWSLLPNLRAAEAEDDDPADTLLREKLKPQAYETLFLTWAGNPLTTMRVQWLEIAGDAPPSVLVCASPEAGGKSMCVQSSTRLFGRREGVWVQRVDFTNLTPSATYRLELPGATDQKMTFQTAPATKGPSLTFAEGGDIGNGKESVELHQVVAGWDPLFGLVGGDLAYSGGANINAEIKFFRNWRTGMQTAVGRLIPMVAGIGNHEVIGNFGKTPAEAPFFYSLFDHWAVPGAGAYGALDFGDYLSIVLLDTNHTCPVASQTEWLRQTLAERSRVPNVFVAYHVPAYPSVRKFDATVSGQVRKEWLPVLEEAARIGVVFEHHDHAFKRTQPLRAGQADPQGIVYLGDGSWGRGGRKLRTEGDLSLFQKRAEEFHVWKVTLRAGEQVFSAVNPTGTEIDAWQRAVDS